MALERRNPLPPGRYWVDILTPKLTSFELMLEREKDNVVVETREYNPNSSNFNASTTTFLFRNARPFPWQQGWSLPNRAGTEVQTPADTLQRPAPEPGPIEQISSMLDDAKTGAVALLALWFLFGGKK